MLYSLLVHSMVPLSVKCVPLCNQEASQSANQATWGRKQAVHMY
jgi:hypothetical protein